MELLKNVQIKNYRGLKQIEFTPKSINIFVGPNNTGKSSLLETISLAMTAGSNFEDSVGFDVLEYLFEIKNYNPSYIVHVDGDMAEILVELNGQIYTISIEYYPEGLPDDERYGIIMEHFENRAKHIYEEYIEKEFEREYSLLQKTLDYFVASAIKHGIDEEIATSMKHDLRRYLSQNSRRYRESDLFSEDQKLLEQIIDEISTKVIHKSKILITVYDQLMNIVKLYLYMPEPVKLRVSPNSKGIRRYYFPPIYIGGIQKIFESTPEMIPHVDTIVNFQKSIFATNVGRLYDLIVSKGIIKKLIGHLKERIPYFEDIRKIEQGMYVMVSHHDNPIPLSSMGDGFIALLNLSFLITLVEQGAIILEEPEISLHPYFMEIIAEEVVDNSERIQFFISTHSMDFLNALLEYAEKEDKLRDINVVRLHYREDTKNVYAEVLGGITAKDEITEIGTDLRYT